MIFRGLNGTVEIKNDEVIIIRNRFLDGIFLKKGIYHIKKNEISKVVYKKGGLTNGYITIARDNDIIPGSIFTAIKCNNSVVFRFPQNDEARVFFGCLKQAI